LKNTYFVPIWSLLLVHAILLMWPKPKRERKVEEKKGEEKVEKKE